MEAFNTAYAATRLQGVVMMLQDATSVLDVAEALAHLDTVQKEIFTAANRAGLYVDVKFN